MFHYSGYWQTWSRVLSHVDGWTVEVNLTPIPSAPASEWDRDVRPVRIRRHCTALGRGDVVCEALPPEVRVQMERHLGLGKTAFLLQEDILPRIDWVEFQKHTNGGCDLQDCLK